MGACSDLAGPYRPGSLLARLQITQPGSLPSATDLWPEFVPPDRRNAEPKTLVGNGLVQQCPRPCAPIVAAGGLSALARGQVETSPSQTATDSELPNDSARERP
jgi:hypothetical protein